MHREAVHMSSSYSLDNVNFRECLKPEFFGYLIVRRLVYCFSPLLAQPVKIPVIPSTKKKWPQQ